MSHIIHLSNSANQDFQAIVVPHGDWVLADVWSSAAWSTFHGVGSWKSVNDFIRVWRGANSGSWSPDFHKAVGKFFDKYAIRVAAGESKEIYGNTPEHRHEYFNASKWGTFSGESSWWVLLRSKDGKWVSTFNSNDDHSWITQGKGQGYEAVRAKPGKVWQADPGAGQHSFEQVKIGSGSHAGANA